MAYLYWIWLPFMFLIVIAVFVIPRHRIKSFFKRINLRGYEGRAPKLLGKYKVNDYLIRLRFKSCVTSTQWAHAKEDIEVFFRKKVYHIEQSRNNPRITDVFLQRKNLPSYIEWKDELMEEGRKFAIGESYAGKVVWDAAILPHGLCAGSSSSGKTNLLRCVIFQAIIKRFNIVAIDMKNGGDYIDLGIGYGNITISNPEEVRNILTALIIEVKSRLSKFREVGVANIDEYNARGREQFLPWLLVVDEAAEVFDVKTKNKDERQLYDDIAHDLRSLARMSRAAGVHILMGFIRPSSEVLDGQIKNNLLWRACGYFADPTASKIVLDNTRATELPPEIKGRFIIGDEEVQTYYMPKLQADNGAVADGDAQREPTDTAPPTGGRLD